MRTIVRVFALAAIASLGACASGPGRVGADAPRINAVLSGDALLIVEADADRNRETTRAEFEAAVADGFIAADTDRNGSLSPLEWQAWSRATMGADLIGPFRLEVDRNVDNQISEQEFTDELIARFERYDTDQSGSVSRAELVRTFDPGGERPRPRARPAGPG